MVAGVFGVVLFFMSLTCFNIINTTSANLHMRRKELAQLRVIGVSKKGLFRMVMLEGVITTILSNVVGIVIGVSVHYFAIRPILEEVTGAKYQFPIVGSILTFLVSGLILCGCG